jgi:hypothetical protein
MKRATHYHVHAIVIKDWARVRVCHVVATSLINSQDRWFHMFQLRTKISENQQISSIISEIRI